MSDATLIARLGNEHTAGPALQQIAERQAMSMQASSSGHPNVMHGWAGADKYAPSSHVPPHLISLWRISIVGVLPLQRLVELVWGHGRGSIKSSYLACYKGCMPESR